VKPADFQGILPFVHAVETGSFTRAAERLRVTTSAIGKSIAQMEQRLGVRLLNRTTRRLSLTSEGQSYFEACVGALSKIDAAQTQLALRRQAPSGRLRVDLPISFGRLCVAPILFEIVQRYPDLNLAVSFTDQFIDLVDEQVDLVVRMRVLQDRSGLMARKLCTPQSIICASPIYFARRGRPKTVEDLAAHALITNEQDGIAEPWAARLANGQIKRFLPRGRLVLGYGEPALDAALAGCGVAFLPTWLAMDYLKRGELETVVSQAPVDTFPIFAMWLSSRTLTPKVRVAVDALAERFSSWPFQAKPRA
jgi:DNA-binding transcriptional LysR family regulator